MRSYTNFAENAGAGAEASRHYSMETVQNIGFWYINTLRSPDMIYTKQCG